MTTHKVQLITVLILFSTLMLNGETKLAIITDPSEPVYIYDGSSENFDVIDTLFYGKFYYFSLIDNSEWVCASAWKGRQTKGFVNLRKIQEVEKLDSPTLKKLILKILDSQRVLASKVQNSWLMNDSLAQQKKSRILNHHSDNKYNPILEILLKYYCSSSDTMILELFISTLWADRGSVNELPALAIASCFICHPETIIEHLNDNENKSVNILILKHIEWGIQNHFDTNKSANFDRLKELIKKARKSRP